MRDRYVLVLDAGTSAIRCSAMDADGRAAATRQAPWPYLEVEGAPAFAREFHPGSAWSAVCDLLRGTAGDAGAGPGQVAAVTATSQRQGVVFLDRDGGEVYAGPNHDARAVFEGAEIDGRMGDAVYEASGHTPSMLLAPAKLRWTQVHRPESYARIASAVCLADWLVYRLSGELLSEPSLACEAGLLDIHRRDWNSGLLEELGLLDNGHVPLVEAGSAAGTVGRPASEATGIPEGTPVAVSGADTQCGLLGMSVTSEGDVGVVAGWSAPLQMVTRRPVLSPSRATWAGCFPVAGRWVAESSVTDAGSSYRWLTEALLGPDEGSFEEMEALAVQVPVGSEGAMAFFGPPRMDMANVGLGQGGLLFPTPVAFGGTGRGHLARAAMEAIAYSVRANLEQIEEVSGLDAGHVSVGGGMTRSDVWTRILVDVLGRPVRVSPTPDASTLGAYLCASTAIGERASLDEAARSVEGMPATVEPDASRALEYEEHYERWTEASEGLGGLGALGA